MIFKGIVLRKPRRKPSTKQKSKIRNHRRRNWTQQSGGISDSWVWKKRNKRRSKNRLPEILKSPKSSSTFARHCCVPASQPRYPSSIWLDARLLQLRPFPSVDLTLPENEKKKKRTPAVPFSEKMPRRCVVMSPNCERPVGIVWGKFLCWFCCWYWSWART